MEQVARVVRLSNERMRPSAMTTMKNPCLTLASHSINLRPKNQTTPTTAVTDKVLSHGATVVADATNCP